jgi:hypothetical protein
VVRIPRVPDKLRLPPGNARWLVLSSGVLALSVMLTVIIGTLGWFGLGSGEPTGGRQTDARVVTGLPCGQRGTEVVAFQQDGRERQATFDSCGHQSGETVQVRVPSPAATLVHSVDATTGAGNHGRGLGLLLLVLAGLAGGGYGVLMQPELRARLGRLRPSELRLRRRG